MDIDLDFADELMTQVQESTDLAIESCSVSFTGLCPDCENELSQSLTIFTTIKHLFTIL